MELADRRPWRIVENCEKKEPGSDGHYEIGKAEAVDAKMSILARRPRAAAMRRGLGRNRRHRLKSRTRAVIDRGSHTRKKAMGRRETARHATR